MAKLWSSSGEGLHPLIEEYTVGEDFRIDAGLLPYDLQASEAHAEMLQSIGVLTSEELVTLRTAFHEIRDLWHAGTFKVLRNQEDCHTAIEQYITEKYGEVGKKIHTGRSRNDQSLTMVRLYAIAQVKEVTRLVECLASIYEVAAAKHGGVPMPGYTHMQRAMPTNVGAWLGSFGCGMRDSLHPLKASLTLIDQNPLGSVAGFGLDALHLDRQMTTNLLGFARTQENPLYCGLSRGLFENSALQAMTMPMILCSRFAVDMMMFTQQETSFFALPDRFVTGSSIMPQKKNYDLFETMRANGKLFGSLQYQVQETIVGLGSGYHRDLQNTKRSFVEACELLIASLKVLIEVVPSLQLRADRLQEAMTKDLFVTEEVYRKVAQGQPFREAYQATKAEFLS